MNYNRLIFAFALSLVASAFLLPQIYAATPSASPQLPISPISWLPIAIGGVLLISALAALVYMLSGLIGSVNAKLWARMQIYEALISVILILAFGFFSYLFFLSPQTAFGSINLVPASCGPQSAQPAADIFTLATCDLSTFNSASFILAGDLFYTSYVGGIIPGLTINIAPIPTQPRISLGFSLATLSPIPISTDNLFKVAFDAFLFMMVLNQLQLLLISGSLMFLAIFMTLGLIVRTFGVTRSFGGALIAFGLGLGLVYPLLVSITYGFIDTNSALSCITSVSTLSTAGCTSIVDSLLAFAAGSIGINTTSLLGQSQPFILTIGYIIAGFTFIPFLNFTILNAFIVDFSKAVGEQMDFMSLLGQFI